jgi:signal transduction histidine kinase
MSRPRVAVAVAAAVAAVGTVVAILVEPAVAPRLEAATMGFTSAAFLAASWLTWTRYRDSRDPDSLFVAVATGILGGSYLIFGVGREWLPRLLASARGEDGTFPREPIAVYSILAAWTVAGVLLLSATPLWERRGRPPIRAWIVIAGSIATTVLMDLLAFGFDNRGYPGLPLPDPVLGPHVTDGLPATRWAIFAPGLLVLCVSAARHATVGRTESLHPWLSVASLFGIPVVVGLAVWPVMDLGGIGWPDVLAPVSAALVLAGALATQRLDTSRMRRESDRAAEITGGRAEIASMVAHEIRGPVTTIRGLAQTSERHYDRLPEDDRREFLRMIEGESDRLLQIADQTSTALKVDAGTLTYTLEPNDLGDVVGVAVDKAATAEHPLATELEPGIRVAIDSVRFGEAVRQLVENAATFSPPDALITVRAYRDGTAAIVEVIDRGPGIPPERRERVFTKFPGFRPPGYEDAAGTGLGLFICRAHILEQGGRIEAKDGPDGGTMLRVTLPEQKEG